jgi:hypothetical protein
VTRSWLWWVGYTFTSMAGLAFAILGHFLSAVGAALIWLSGRLLTIFELPAVKR